MKMLLVVCLLGSLALATAETVLYPRGCLYIMGRCQEECPVGTHAYALGCDYRTPEPTCEDPTPATEEYMICDYSACYCDAPYVRDTESNTCIPLDQCPKRINKRSSSY